MTDWGQGFEALRRNDEGAARMKAERDRQLVVLASRSPMRARGKQSDAGHLPLFVSANEPVLL